MTFGELLDLWQREHVPHLRSKTIEGSADKHLRESFVRLAHVTPDVLESLLNG